MSGITPEFVAEALRAEIAEGRVTPGTALRQEELAERFGVSRIPIREALRQLEADGVVVVQANRGAFVRCFSVQELREIYDIRILLETDLLRRSVRNMTSADMEHISAEVDSQAHDLGGTRLRLADRRFHEALYAPARRPHQLAMVMKLRDSIAHYTPAVNHMQRLTADWMDDHLRIAEACARRDASAAVRILKHHLQVAAELTLGNIDRDPERDGKPAVHQV